MFGNTRRIFDYDPHSKKFVSIGTKSVAREITKPKNKQENIRIRVSESENIGETASLNYGSGASGASPSSTSAEINIFEITQPLFSNLTHFEVNNEAHQANRKALAIHYKDMYYHDSISGGAVDLQSTLPFSDFTLITNNKREERAYNEAVEALALNRVLPSISIEHNVLGAFLASTDWNDSKKNFKGLIPHSIEYAELSPNAYFGKDPAIKLKLPKQYLDFINSMSDKPNIFSNTNSELTLKEESTIFIPRRATLSDYGGISYFRRALAPWLIEKAFIRGMIDQSYKRQRPITHITMGDGDEWTPSPEEMNAVAQLFIEADLDPVSSYVITRNGISVNDVRNASDYFKWSDVYDSLTSIKLRSLGISESFLSAEASYATMEQTLSVFMEQMRAYRSMITREAFYEKVFVRIAKTNNFVKRIGETANDADQMTFDFNDIGNAEIAAAGNTTLSLPKVQWQKRLLPEADDAYLQILTTLEEKGVPIPLRIWAASGGFSLQELLEAQKDDIDLRTKTSEWKKAISDLSPKEESEVASFLGLKRKGLLNRDFSDPVSERTMEFANIDSSGNRRVSTKKGRDVASEKQNKIIASVLADRAENINSEINRNKKPSKTFYGHTFINEGK